MNSTLLNTNLALPQLQRVYHGKVRDAYFVGQDLLAMVVTDRISAFDVILPWGIPSKGQILNQIAAYFLDATQDIVPNWKLATPDPMVTIGYQCEPYPVEMVIRGYLSGHAWREYKAGKRTLCGVPLPEGLRENERLPHPIITPTTKAQEGHDEDISREEIISRGLVAANEYEQLERYTQALFARGTEMAHARGLILVDTKYEFGKRDGAIMLIDEIHTPDSSRYFYEQGYEEHLSKGEPQRQLSKEFVREWLMECGFQGQAGQTPPAITPQKALEISQRYCELYEGIVGQTFQEESCEDLPGRIERNIRQWIEQYNNR